MGRSTTRSGKRLLRRSFTPLERPRPVRVRKLTVKRQFAAVPILGCVWYSRYSHVPTIPEVTVAAVRDRVGEQSYARGREYFKAGAIRDPLAGSGMTLKAECSCRRGGRGHYGQRCPVRRASRLREASQVGPITPRWQGR